MDDHTFSVILPVRNGGSLVKDCVSSILNQHYQNFNLIVLDNCSDDGTLEWIINLYNSKIVVIPSLEPLTIEKNWERILTVNKNEFITLIGHDDLLAPDYLQTINNLIAQHPTASLYQTHFSYINVAGSEIRPCKPMSEIQKGHEFLASLLTNQIDLMGTGFVMRSTDYNSIGGIPGSFPNLLFSDLVLFFELAHMSYKATSFKNCFSFRLHQSTTSLSADTKLQQAFQQIVNYLAELKSDSPILNDAIERYGVEFVMFYCKALSHRMLRKRRSKDQPISVKQFIKLCGTYAQQLSPAAIFDPYKDLSVRLGSVIDSNILSRELFLLFKNMYSKPFV